uniref:IQ motif and ubiquitin-like domain-containing protein n=1 Tax=Trypanosoma congolense (strain IL3000) TaxID=1068625 RepID=G0UPU0_TRYCI|nr:conserved hypothetical protein [Trypanosoma congolense IL3000]
MDKDGAPSEENSTPPTPQDGQTEGDQGGQQPEREVLGNVEETTATHECSRMNIPCQSDASEYPEDGDTGCTKSKDVAQPEFPLVGAEVASVARPPEEVEELPSSAEDGCEVLEVMEQCKQPSYGVQAQLEIGDAPAGLPSRPLTHESELEVPEPFSNGYLVSADIEVTAYVTVQPVGFQIVVKAPGGKDGEIYSGFLYECIASRLGMHPESLRLCWRGERLRFGVTVSYEPGPAAHQGQIWVDVYFSEGTVPEHLMCLNKDEHFMRAIRVRSRLEPIGPSDLISARRRGLSFEEAIIEARERTKPQNYMTISILHDPAGIRLPFLGGYRSKKDGSRIFRHAATQLSSPGNTTLADLQYGPIVRDKVTRKTQTYGVSRSCQTLREGRMQTARPDYEVDEKFDEVVVAKPYFSSQQLHSLQSVKIVVIQKMYRKWKARKVYRQLADIRQAFLNKAARQAAAEEAERRRHEEFELGRRAVPRTADDFKTLRRELEIWRASESERILADSSLNDAQKRTALSHLTNKEIKLLRELETLRGNALNNRRVQRFENILDTMTSAKKCGPVSVVTQAAERAYELRQLYVSLTEVPKTTEGRLDILLHIKWTVKEFDAPLTRQIVELIDREADLLQRGRTACSLKGLRTRLENLLKRFIATPEYNPAVDEVVKGPRFGVTDATNIMLSRQLRPSNVV